MIRSNLTEVYQNKYLSYIASRYENKWHICTQGNIIYPVISLDSLGELFGIDLSSITIPHKRVKTNSYEPRCDINGITINIDQLKEIGYQYKLTNRKAYVDLMVGYNVCCYNNYLTESLVLLADDMYNAIQLHKEFSDSVLNYCKSHISNWRSEWVIEVNIDTNSQGICYKELMDFAHYNCSKPEITFKVTKDSVPCHARITVEDYEMLFSETSYNIEIRNILFD